jgi:hypothetical protein
VSKEQKIQTRIFEYGDEKESDWPPKFGTRKAGVYYWDSESQSFKEGYPPRKTNNFGVAPYFIQDSITPYYHPGVCKTIDSRSALAEADKACGTITTDQMIPGDRSVEKKRIKEIKEDHHKALRKAVAQVDAGTAPLSEETRALCERQNEIVSKALNFDAFNVVGRKNNPRGKRFKRK